MFKIKVSLQKTLVKKYTKLPKHLCKKCQDIFATVSITSGNFYNIKTLAKDTHSWSASMKSLY